MQNSEKILLVDDEPSIRHLLNRLLSKEGYSCSEAESGEQAMAKLAAQPAELVVLDMRLPGKSGLELLPEIKACCPETSVLMATAVTDIHLAIQCMKEGAEDFISKPFNLEEVSLSVKRVLEKRQLQLKINEYQSHLEQKVDEQTQEIRKLFLGSIESLVAALEAKDKYTAGHSRRVTDISGAIGKRLGLGQLELENLNWGSLLHDVGKIAVDQMILNKPGKLTQFEYEHVMAHAHIGAGIVKPVVNVSVMDIIDHHHDKYDGSGIHQTLRGDAIPLGARILTLADAFDAMTSDRPYRCAMQNEKAVEEIERCSGTQFDPRVVRAFLDVRDSLEIK